MLQDNQLGTDLSWLAGILEGEGCFCLKSKTKMIRIFNTDIDIIDECVKILNSLLLVVSVGETSKNRNKTKYDVYIPKLEGKILYQRINDKVECRINEFQQFMEMGPSTTAREVSIDLHWMVGIWEAEGTFSLSRALGYKDGYLRYKPTIQLANTNPRIISKVRKNLQQLGLAYHCQDYKVGSNKPYTTIGVTGMKRCKRFLDAMQGFWRSTRNKKRSSLMKEFVDTRLAVPENTPYTDKQADIWYQIKMLNR